MSTLLLSLLLVLLVALGMLMVPAVERFANPEPAPAPVPVVISPTLANLLATPPVPGPVPQVNIIAREQEVQPAAPAQKSTPKKPEPEPEPSPAACPACPVCPDMSQYVRLDEVPCWNCTLP